MRRLLMYLVAAGCMGTSTLLVSRNPGTRETQNVDARLAIDGAFRDGLYIGGLDRAAHRNVRPPIGRWAQEKDRAAFVIGYRQGRQQD